MKKRMQTAQDIHVQQSRYYYLALQGHTSVKTMREISRLGVDRHLFMLRRIATVHTHSIRDCCPVQVQERPRLKLLPNSAQCVHDLTGQNSLYQVLKSGGSEKSKKIKQLLLCILSQEGERVVAKT
mmetsp:Transcript_7565/g.46535  ORF Transcript_7565/g.46535 Transcript_7565/m.46535 type:complete len:126 (+) Transcript_7565:2484-2861(+)